VECLSGIPGTVGGTPVQNVGAYGQEVSQTITSVRLVEISSGKVRDWSNSDCGFAYRTSILNTTQRDRYIVLKVTFQLTNNARPTVEYADLRKFFAAPPPDHVPTIPPIPDPV